MVREWTREFQQTLKYLSQLYSLFEGIGVVRRIELILPTEYEEAWDRLKSLYGLGDGELLMKLIETELQTMKTREHIEAYEKVEKAMREIEEVAGIDGLVEFANKVSLIAKKIREAIE